MDIAGLSEKTAETLHDRLNIREPAELYGITREQLLLLPGYKDKKADNLLDALAGSRDCSLDAFLFAVGIPNIGRVTARSIAEHFGTLDKVRAASTQDLQGIDEIGDVVAQSLWDFFRDPLTAGVIDHLLKAGVVPRDATAAAQGTALAGRSVVVTGTLPTLSRQQAEQLIREAGGNASSAVSRKTAYVVAGDNPGSKLSKAQSLGIPVITEARLLEIVKGS
jgi:DNA ligase (NAD+)